MLFVKIKKHIGFSVYRWSCLLWPPELQIYQAVEVIKMVSQGRQAHFSFFFFGSDISTCFVNHVFRADGPPPGNAFNEWLRALILEGSTGDRGLIQSVSSCA